MKFEDEILDKELISERFDLSTLWKLHSELMGVKIQMENAQQIAMDYRKTMDAVNLEKQLHYIRGNIQNVEFVLSEKVEDLFEFDGIDLICKN